MIKRVFWVALFTGLSHLISLITISFVLTQLGEEVSGYLGLIDSTVMLVSAIISFGIQLAVNRNVATRENWWANYKMAQSSRLALSFLVLAFGLVSYLIQGDITQLIYCYAPLVALNGDYALYGNGKPIAAASLSFLRVALPNLGVLATGYWLGPEVVPVYIVLLAAGIFLAGVIAARFNGVQYFYRPRKKFLRFYYKYLKVGLYQVTGTLLVPGVLVIANWFYAIETIGLLNGLLKLLIVYKGGLRIIVQTFFKEIRLPRTPDKIDKASLLAWGLISIPVIFYYDTTIHLLYKDKYDSYPYLLPFFGLIMLLSAFRNAAEAKALLNRQDNLNLYVFIGALVAEVGVLALIGLTSNSIWGLPMGFLAGELVLVLGLGIGLHHRHFFRTRLVFLLKLSPALLLIGGVRYLMGDNLYWLAGAVVFYLLWCVVFYRKLIFTSLTEDLVDGE